MPLRWAVRRSSTASTCIDPVRCRSLGPNVPPTRATALARPAELSKNCLFLRFGKNVYRLPHWASGGLNAIMDGNTQQ